MKKIGIVLLMRRSQKGFLHSIVRLFRIASVRVIIPSLESATIYQLLLLVMRPSLPRLCDNCATSHTLLPRYALLGVHSPRE